MQQSSRLSIISSGITAKQPTTINVLSTTHSDSPAFNTRSRTAQQTVSNSTPRTDAIAPDVTEAENTTPKSLSAE